MSKHLWRVGIIPEYEWQPKPKALYVVMETKEKAREYATKHLKSPFKVGKIARLGEQLGGSVFRG
jgi:hypothetical protein